MSFSNNGANGNFLKGTASMPALTASWTVAAWVAATQNAQVSTFISIESAGAVDFIQFFANAATRQPVYGSSGAGTVNFPGGLFTNGAFVFYCASHTGNPTNTTAIYRGANGGALATTSFADTTSFTPTSILAFNENANDEGANALVLGYKIWNGVALTAREVTNQYFQLRPMVEVASVERWIPLVISANPGQAYMGLSRNLTLTGALTATTGMPSVPWAPPSVMN